ncbi:MAG: HD domain-containing protein [Chloroflexi bacterium]|nr:HD domain-containing protein [Chloroflexota bacterium]
MLWSQDKYVKALYFAAGAHGRQQVPGTRFSYVVHLSAVCMEVMAAIDIEKINNPDLAVQCALLHDVLEDTKVEYDQISIEFGKEVADGVFALTKETGVPKDRRVQQCINKIRNSPIEVGMVKLADRITNLHQPLVIWSDKKVHEYWEESKYIYINLKHCSHYLSERLEHKIGSYSRHVNQSLH